MCVFLCVCLCVVFVCVGEGVCLVCVCVCVCLFAWVYQIKEGMGNTYVEYRCKASYLISSGGR